MIKLIALVIIKSMLKFPLVEFNRPIPAKHNPTCPQLATNVSANTFESSRASLQSQ